MVRAMAVVAIGLRRIWVRAIARVRLRAAARMATRRQGNWRKRSSGAWRQMGAEMGVRRRVMVRVRMARAVVGCWLLVVGWGLRTAAR